MDQQSIRSRTALGDVTNTCTRGTLFMQGHLCVVNCKVTCCNQGVPGVPSGETYDIEDSKDRKRRKERERYAAMPQEKKDELNWKRRERRKQKNVHASGIEEGDHVDTQTAAVGDEILISVETIDNGMRGNCIEEGIAGARDDTLINTEMTGNGKHGSCFESPIAERGVPNGQAPDKEDSKDRKRRKEKERYAATSQEKKDEVNRKRRERRKLKNVHASDVCVPMEEGEHNEWSNIGNLDQYNGTEHDATDTPDGCVPMEEGEHNEWHNIGNLDQYNDTEHDAADTPDGGETLAGAETNEDGIECTKADGGAADETTPVYDQNLSPGERRCRRDRARRAATSPLQKEVLNKRRRDARAAKILFKTPQERKDSRRQSNLNYKQRIKEQRANNLHPNSIAMANPQFKPELIFPPGDKPSSRLSDQMEIPDFGGTPVYVEADVQEPPQQVETPETFLSNTIHTAHLTPGLRHSQRKRRNQEFEATIGRNTKRATGENENIASQPTQSCVIDNGNTQTYPHGDGTLYPAGAGDNITCFNSVGTSGHASLNERCTQTQPSVVDEPDSMPPRDLHRYPCQAGDENIIFDEDVEVDEGFLFAGQEDAADDVVDVDLTGGDEDNIEPDAPDPFGAVYGNVPEDGHTLKLVDNCEFCNAKKFEYEPPGFCCRSGDIHLSTPDTSPDELV